MSTVAAPPPGRRVPGDPAVTEELRLAISMRGGVSLAVWIGGASAVVFALVGTSWMRARHRALAVLLTAAIYGVLALLFRSIRTPPGSWWQLERPFPAGWWTIGCVAVTAIAPGIHVSHAQVFPRRPGRPS